MCRRLGGLRPTGGRADPARAAVRRQGKEETHGIERDHSRQRHWLARFRRRTCVVSRAERMVEASIALFARFADDRGIDELLSMLD